MNQSKPEESYSRILKESLNLKILLSKQATYYSVARLLVFLLIIVAGNLAFTKNSVFWIISVGLLAAFIWLMIRHIRVQGKQKFNDAYITAVKQEIEACNGDFSSFDGCSSFSESSHQYALDLDIFGDFSLCQMLNRTVSPAGSKILAEWLKNSLKKAEEIYSRRDAIKELAEMPEWRLRFRALGLTADESPGDLNSFYEWLETPALFNKKIFAVILLLTPLASLLALVLLITGILNIQLFILYLFIPLSVTGIYTKRIGQRHMMLSRKTSLLYKYASRFVMVEDESFSSGLLAEFSSRLKQHDFSAGKSISQLGWITSSLDTRLNLLAGFVLNVLLLWDIRQMRRLEEWQSKHRSHPHVWFNILAETDALTGMAAFAYSNPEFIFPTINTSCFGIKAVDSGHPLIPADDRVNNNINLNGSGSFNIITGANMAGKSTYLRTIGVNLILALNGCPVCASSFECYPAGVFTSLRTTDSLSASQSYFFAELLRLKELIDRLKSGEQLYILLDEILKGTNSADKQAGSKALLTQLIQMNASGFIATHDLELGKLADVFPGLLVNNSFEAEIINDTLHFDYKLKPGIARNMNATFLMRKMGITIQSG